MKTANPMHTISTYRHQVGKSMVQTLRLIFYATGWSKIEPGNFTLYLRLAGVLSASNNYILSVLLNSHKYFVSNGLSALRSLIPVVKTISSSSIPRQQPRYQRELRDDKQSQWCPCRLSCLQENHLHQHNKGSCYPVQSQQ